MKEGKKEKPLSYYVHPTCIMDKGVRIGEGTKIWCYTHILQNARIGRKCNIGQNVMIGSGVGIGSRCKIQNNVSVYEGVTLEDEVFCGPSMVFTNVFNPRSAISRMKEMKKTLVKKGATIGANATIICGNTIGKSAFVGAGAVVTRDIPDYALVVGNPARIKGWVCECGIKLATKNIEATGEEKVLCEICGKLYLKKSAHVRIFRR